jgi:hypothetical protein
VNARARRGTRCRDTCRHASDVPECTLPSRGGWWSRVTRNESRSSPSSLASSSGRLRRRIVDASRSPACADREQPCHHMGSSAAVLPPPSPLERREQHWKRAIPEQARRSVSGKADPSRPGSRPRPPLASQRKLFVARHLQDDLPTRMSRLVVGKGVATGTLRWRTTNARSPLDRCSRDTTATVAGSGHTSIARPSASARTRD